jgi:D-alanyl-D-alanine dipeptidase
MKVKITLNQIKHLFLKLLIVVLLIPGCLHGPPQEQGRFREPELVEVTKLDSTIRLDIHYATIYNFMHRQVYTQARAFLQRPAAEALARVNRLLHEEGYGLVIFDAYRPWSVTKRIWDLATDADREKNFVANPREGSKHNRGCAVDLSLFDLKTGSEVVMPSGFDDFSERAYPTYPGGTSESRRLRDLLRHAMETQNFEGSNEEWWHFNYRDWREYRRLNIPFEMIDQ